MSATYSRKSSVDVSTAGDRVVLYDRDSRRALTLNPVASQLWNQLQSPQTMQELIDFLLNNFDGVADEQARKDTEVFLNELNEYNLVSVTAA